MHLSVAICTWNRARMLRQTLDHLTRVQLPAGDEWELLVVDNNCTDGTGDVIAGFAGRLPVRCVREPSPGISHARNTATRAARGAYIVWIDDDVIVAPDWLRSYREAFALRPEAAVFGGPIEPWFEGAPPAWLSRVWRRVGTAYAWRDFGADAVPLSHERVPFGANFAVRADVQRRMPYDPQLGVRPTSSARGEETTVIRAILAQGGAGWWVPHARVRHCIPAERQSVGYLRRYFSDIGQQVAHADGAGDTRHFLGRPLWLWREALTAEARYRVRRAVSSPDVWIDDLVHASFTWGRFRKRGAPDASKDS
ncbi:MAG: glycosyltransferase [Gemmatimonadaceae bacterium]